MHQQHGHAKAPVQVHYNEVPVAGTQLHRRNWTPFAIRAPFLIFIVVLLLFCVTSLEVLVHKTGPLQPMVSQNVKFLARQVAGTDSNSGATTAELTFSTNPSGYLVLSTTTTTAIHTAPQATPPNAYLQLSSTTTTPYTTSMPAVTTTTQGGIQYSQQQSTPSTTSLPLTPSISSPPASQSLSSTITPGPSVTSSSSTSSAQSTQSVIIQAVSDARKPHLQVDGGFRISWYFTAMYVPSIIAVVLKESWAMTASGLKMMEPFYLLNQFDGAAAKDTLMADYLSSTTSSFTLKKAITGNLPMIVVILVNIVMSFLAPIASESMTIMATVTYIYSDGHTERLNPAWAINLVFVRVLQAVLSVVAFLVLFMALYGRGRRSGLAANPSKISTMASLMNHSGAVQDVNSINPTASKTQIAESLEHKRYMIGDYQDAYGTYHSGLVRVGETVPQGLHRVPLEDVSGPTTAFAGSASSDTHIRHRSHSSTSQKLFDGLFLVFVMAFLGTVIAYQIVGNSSGFNDFFNSGEFGPKFVLSLGASVITMTFQHMERQVRLTLPYRRLAQKRAGAEGTILRSVNGTALSGMFQSVRHGTWFHLFIATTAVLGDVLIVAVAGVPFNDALTYLTFTVSVYLTIGIALVMIAAAVSIFLWRLTNKKLDLPPQPNESMVRVCMSLSNQGNQVRAMLGDLGHASDKELRARCRREGGTYFAGWIRDEYGRDTWCVDKEYDQTTTTTPPPPPPPGYH